MEGKPNDGRTHVEMYGYINEQCHRNTFMIEFRAKLIIAANCTL